MYEKMKRYIMEKQILKPGEGVIVALSGGADSVALLYLLKEWAKEMSSPFFAVHINHGIRGEEAQRDENFVRKLCQSLQVPILVFQKNVPEYVKEHGCSLETGARILRYQCLEEAAKEKNCKIAVAHHMEDQAETILFRMIRGSGIDGLAGMSSKNQKIIRPLLGIRKDEILAYLEKNYIEYVEDTTNLDVAYARNRIRHNILPELSMINEKAVEHIAMLGEYAKHWSNYIGKETKKAYTKTVKSKDGLIITVKEFLSYPELIQSQVLRQVIRTVANVEQDVYGEHIKQLLNLFSMENGKRIQLPFSISAAKEYETVRVFVEEENTSFWKAVSLDLEKEITFELPKGSGIFSKSLVNQGKIGKIQKNLYTKTIDCDRINSVLMVRTRQPEDTICINEEGQRKKLSRYLIDEKVPKSERDKVIVVADGSHIVWVIGYRIGFDYKVGPNTKHTITMTVVR